jgi:hypothetical protein
VNRQTILEQMFYEVHDPANYITPDVVVDFTSAEIEEVGPNRVRVSGISGKTRTDTLKVSIGAQEGFIGEDMFFYAGPGALERAKLAETILRERFKIVGLKAEDLRIDFLGVNAIHGALSPAPAAPPYEVAVRVAARTKTRPEAEKIGREVDAMAVSGVGHTGKRVPHAERVREVIGIWSALVPRGALTPAVHFVEEASAPCLYRCAPSPTPGRATRAISRTSWWSPTSLRSMSRLRHSSRPSASRRTSRAS